MVSSSEFMLLIWFFRSSAVVARATHPQRVCEGGNGGNTVADYEVDGRMTRNNCVPGGRGRSSNDDKAERQDGKDGTKTHFEIDVIELSEGKSELVNL